MIRDVMGLMEILSLLIVLAAVYEEKIKFNIYAVVFIISELVFISGLNNHGWPIYLSCVFYILLFSYALLNYRSSVKKTILNCVIAYIVIAIIQLISYWIIGIFLEVFHIKTDYVELIVSVTYLVMCILLANKLHLSSLSGFFVKKNKLLWIAGSFILILLGSQAWIIKKTHTLDSKFVLIMIYFVVLLLTMTAEWQKSRLDAEKRKMQLELNKLYYGAYEELIQTIREKQHDYKNHINALQGLLYATADSDITVNHMKKYLGTITDNFDDIKVLTMIEKPLIAGFVNYEIVKAQNMGICVKQNCVVPDISIKIPEYQIVEILGILFDNAIEAAGDSVEKKVEISIQCENDKIVFSISNSCKTVPYNDFDKFFRRGYSTKGVNRGMGLAKLKNMVDDNGGNILVSSKELNNEMLFKIEVVLDN